jgi:hypothetical protein
MTITEFLRTLVLGGVVEDSSGIRWRLTDDTFMTSSDQGQTWERGGYLEYVLSTPEDLILIESP